MHLCIWQVTTKWLEFIQLLQSRGNKKELTEYQLHTSIESEDRDYMILHIILKILDVPKILFALKSKVYKFTNYPLYIMILHIFASVK